ncbi:hypothetical protein Tco_1540764 [Tanacetum coccineum]
MASPPYNTPSQSSPFPAFNLDEDLEPLWGIASQPFPSHDSKGSSQPVQDDSPVEEVAAPVKRKYTKRPQQSKKNDKDLVNPLSPEEEIALCKAWVDVSENNVQGNVRRAKGYKNGANELYYYDLAHKEYRTTYGGSKKSWTSKTTSHDTSDSLHIGLDLNDEVVDSEDVEVEVRHMGQDRSKKKASSSIARSESSAAVGEAGIESSSEYLRIKERELELERLKLEKEERMEQIRLTQHMELEAQRIAHERQQLEFERERYEWKKQAKKEN